MKKTLCIGDVHAPWVDEDSLKKVYAAITRDKPLRVVQIGDLYDMFAHSKFPKTFEVTPDEEMREAADFGQAFWKTIKRLAPRAELIQIMGNHDIRVLKRCEEKYPEIFSFARPVWESLYTFAKVKTYFDPREVVVRDSVAFIHGWKTRLGDHMRHIGMNCVRGHDHKLGVHFERLNGRVLAELDCGYIGDEKSKPLSYTQTKADKWHKGYGFWDDYGPRAIPF